MFRNPISIHLTMLGQNWQCYRTAKKNSPPIGVLEPQPTSKSGLGNLTRGYAALSQMPTFLAVEQKFFYGDIVKLCLVTCENVGTLVTTRDEKTAPPLIAE